MGWMMDTRTHWLFNQIEIYCTHLVVKMSMDLSSDNIYYKNNNFKFFYFNSNMDAYVTVLY